MKLFSRRPFSAHLRRLLDAAILVWTSSPGWTLTNSILVLLQGLLPLVALLAMKQIVDVVSLAVATGKTSTLVPQLILWVTLAGGVAVLTALCRSLAELASEILGQLVTDKVSDALHQQSAAVDLAFYEDPRYFNTLHRAQQEAPYRPMLIVNNFLQSGQSAIVLLGILGILASYNWLLSILIVFIAIPGAYVRFRYAKRAYGLQQQQTEFERRSSYYHILLTEPFFAKEVRLFQLGSFFRARFDDLRRQLRNAKFALSRRRMLADLLTQAVASAAIFGALGYIALQTMYGRITLGAMVMYYQSFQMCFSSFQGLFRNVTGLYEHSLFLTNYHDFISLRPTLTAIPPVLPIPAEASGGIRFQNVDFSYPGCTEPVLRDITLEIAPGEIIALVGENGSGKSTLTKLLCRLYDPTSGQISLNGTDIRHFKLDSWRNQISVVFQDYVRYFLTARENIWLGDVEGGAAFEDIVRAAKESGADEVIQRLAKGYDTQLGNVFVDGQELSTGEWQKIAVARAFLRNSPYIVLDEPSSALDPLAEADLFKKFRALMKGRSALLVSHRLSTVQLADCIYVMHDGRIVESGAHQDLLNKGGEYAHLYQLQAEYYQSTPDIDIESAVQIEGFR